MCTRVHTYTYAHAYTYVYVCVYVYVYTHVHAHSTCASFARVSPDIMYLMSVGLLVLRECLVGVRERTVQFGGKELFGGYNCW